MLIDNFEIHNLQYQPMMFSPGQGPAVPNLPDVPHFIQPYLQSIGGVVVNTVTQGATGQGTHAGRVFLYNQIYANNFQNPTFMMAVATTADYVLLGISRNEIAQNNIADGINMSVVRALGLLSAHNIQRHGQLASYLPPEIVNEAMQLQQSAGQMQGVINSLKAQYMQQPMQQAYQPPQYPTYAQPQQMQPMQQHGGMGYATASTGGNPAFQMPGNYPQQQQSPAAINAPRFDTGRHSHLSVQAAKVVQTPAQYQAPVQPTAMPVLKEPKTSEWVCSPLQAYNPTYYADSEILTARRGMDPINQLSVIITQITPLQPNQPSNGDNMDRSQHQITHGYQHNNNPGKPTGENLAIKSGEVLSVESKAVMLRSDLYEEPTYAGGGGIVLTRDEALLKTQHRLMVLNKGKVTDKAVTASYLLAKPIITCTNYSEMIRKLTEHKSLAAMTSAMQRMAASNNPEMKHLVEQLNTYATAEFNAFLRDKLSLPIELDSFVEDAASVIDYANSKHGSIYGDAIAENQDSFLQKIFTPMDKDIYDSIIYTMIDPGHSAKDVEGEEEQPYATAVFQFITVTAVGFTAAQLNVGLLENHCGVLTQDRFPGLLTYAKNTLKTAMNNEHPVAHHYIVTSDLQVYEVHQGLIGIGTYLISKVQ